MSYSEYPPAASSGGGSSNYPPVSAFQTNALQTNVGSTSISIPDAASLQITGAYTISMWINPGYSGATTYPATIALLFKGNTAFSSAIKVGLSSGSMFAANAGNATPSANTVVPMQSWTYCSWVADGAGNLTFYQNGISVGTGATPHPFDPVIGTAFSFLSNGGGAALTGIVREVQIWNVARTAVQLQTDMLGSVNPASNGLVLYYQMRDGFNATTLHDATSFANNCSISGSGWSLVGSQLTPL